MMNKAMFARSFRLVGVARCVNNYTSTSIATRSWRALVLVLPNSKR